MSKTSSKSKDKYNEATYARFTLRIRKESTLYDDIQVFTGKKGTSLNHLATKLLSEHFDKLRDEN